MAEKRNEKQFWDEKYQCGNIHGNVPGEGNWDKEDDASCRTRTKKRNVADWGEEKRKERQKRKQDNAPAGPTIERGE